MRKWLAWALIVVLSLCLGYADGQKECQDCLPVYGGLPAVSANSPVLLDAPRLLENCTYVVGYSDARMNPLWVSYRVYEVEHVGSAPSPGWRIDRETGAWVSNSDYEYTGYERGHMAPKSAIYHCYGDDAVYDTFKLSNACPQLKEFNNGAWKQLETLVRETYSIELDEVWIIAGPIFDDRNGRLFLTKDAEHAEQSQKAVEIPDSFYKIIIDEEDGEIRTLAFIMEHSVQDTTGTASSSERLRCALRSIDEIEKATGLDFLTELDELLEAELERVAAVELW